MALHIQSFTKGIDKDSSVNKYPNDVAYHIENFRFITDEGLTTMSLENIKGTTFSFQLPDSYLIWGHTVLRNTLVILAINPNKVTNDATDRIYVATINEDGTITGLTQKCQVELDFNLTNKITDVVSRYESEDLQKIYWCDGVNRLKFANIVDPNIGSRPSEWFNYYATFTPSTITINSILSGGNLKSGMIQYAYQLYNLYGAQTFFTIPTSLYGLTSFNTTGNDSLFVGDASESNSGKQVNLSISNLDTNFNRIKIVRLLHTNLLNDPEITIIYDGTFDSSFKLVDNGTQNLGTLTKAEFNFTNYDFIPKNLETKNNILFPSNIIENSWNTEYDARTYRFTWSATPVGYIWDADGTNPLLVDRVNFNNVPEDHDCYNKFNDFRLDSPTIDQSCRASGNQLGGSGKNIEYYFHLTERTLDNSINSPIVETNFNDTLTNPEYYSSMRGYHRDEIYSFAIVLINTKGQRSYPKWIGDIRFPRMADYYTYNLTNNTGNKCNILGITFIVRNLPSDCVAFQIVRCERKAEDRTILAQGLIGMTRIYNGFNCAFPTLSTIREYYSPTQPRTGGLVGDKKLLEFISPEIMYNKNLTYSGGDILDTCGIAYLNRKYGTSSQTVGTTLINNKSYNYDSVQSFAIHKVSSVTTDPSKELRRNDIVDFKIVDVFQDRPDGSSASAGSIAIAGKTYENYSRGFFSNLNGKHGTVGIVAIDFNISISSFEISDIAAPFGEKYMLANYRRFIQPYGGASYEARTRRVYIPCSEVQASSPGNTYTLPITNGDTFISKFEYQRTMAAGLVGELATNETLVESFIFPVETSISTRWQSNKTFSQLFTNSSATLINKDCVTIQETAGVHNKDNGIVEAYFTQEKNLYTYNSVYSKENSSTVFIPKPLDLIDNPSYDARIHYSDRKFNNENIDSWTIFRPLNFKDVDSNYGPINTTINYNHDFIFFQDSGIGIASIEEREIVQSTAGSTSVIGQGGILSRYDYIYTNGGCQDKESVIMGRYRLYWYDRMNNSIFSFNRDEGINNISKLNGLHSFFNSIGVNNITNVISGVDPRYNDIYFTIKTSIGYYTLVYNEIGKIFTQFVTVDSDKYIEFENYLYSVKDNNQVYLHNTGDYGSFHGTLYPSKLTLVINPRQMLINRFDILELLTRVTFNGTELHETFTTLRIRDSYQDTGIITLQDEVNIRERLRKWRFNSIWSTDEYNSRFKDSYVTIDLEFTNDGSKHIVLSDIIMLYQESFSK